MLYICKSQYPVIIKYLNKYMKPMYYMTKRNLLTTIGMLAVVSAFAQKEYPSRAPMTPAMSEYWTPQPPIVTPGKAPAEAIGAPSDAIILFDGKDLSQWENSKGQAAGWTVHDGVFTVKKGTGDIRTKQKFNDFQLHLEWCIPEGIEGTNQARGNSGVFLQGIYEIQILDNYENETYVNGQAGSIYKQTPPLVNAMNKPGVWNTFDIIYTAPTFKKDGYLPHTSTCHCLAKWSTVAEQYDHFGDNSLCRFSGSDSAR